MSHRAPLRALVAPEAREHDLKVGPGRVLDLARVAAWLAGRR